MVIIKKQVKAYIALEGLIATGLILVIVTLILSALHYSQQELSACRQKQELLNTAVMAIQTKQRALSLNGCHIKLLSHQKGIAIVEKDQTIIRIERQ
ncbi:competence protein ComG [Streptococcus equi subsp. zooepidemicus]|uniref:competence type IV pilus minor pilin ComGE n=1 Tax=Streptococcus equi TaxID=1336 RepID=UPI0005BAB214|nr:competence type IV pilus minor pilin ComGE [Streptococcus equi]MCD3395359.1 competence protein ComG [Streptococcus equi subsp. zooepidemicus]MCD3432680.1 competence protein ComG [Streptococcus equi subsp. zooepidemicus]MCD3436920.1 competence protein ComG [Streptococcus equi subsp. zooepidemicus]MCD3449081.1 competence protein ComG [Streptococcus equi subsp. zooepidemicus]MCD3460150.1 competence protein ComG [Streptococcus equi subsp. zooepidemicus]